MKKTFFNLIQDVHKQGKCSHCGGCVTFCSAINYGALVIDSDGKPCFGNIDNCIECGLCYSICPSITELDAEIKLNAQWEAPLGNIIEISITHARDDQIRQKGTDGGVVTALLIHLFDSGKINGAIVSKNTRHGRIPCLARTKQDIINSAGSHFSSSQGMVQFAREYATFSPSLAALSQVRSDSPDRLAFVGTPCQINTIRKMQALRIVPSDSILYCFGLFCSGNFLFNKTVLNTLGEKYDIRYSDIEKINIKDDFLFSLASGEQLKIPLQDLDPVKRVACNYCGDFSAEYADISFGGLGAENGWTTVITRTPAGKKIFAQALKKVLTPFRFENNPKFVTQAEKKIRDTSLRKRQRAQHALMKRNETGVRIIS